MPEEIIVKDKAVPEVPAASAQDVAAREKEALAYYDSQKIYYSTRAAQVKRIHDALQIVVLIGHVFVPLLLLADIPKWIPFVLAVAVALAAAAERRFQFGERWLNFRITAEALRREKILYTARAGRYHRKNALAEDLVALFVEHCTSLCAEETERFRERELKSILEAIEEDKQMDVKTAQKLRSLLGAPSDESEGKSKAND